jgi:chemotaxis signal transduction protein
MESEGTVQSVEQWQYLTFFIADEEYAVSIIRVKEIIQYDTLTKVPKTPHWIRGVINLRGAVVPVVDLAVKFGLPETAITSSACIVITEVEIDGETTVMGVLADSVSQVIELRGDDIEPPPKAGCCPATTHPTAEWSIWMPVCSAEAACRAASRASSLTSSRALSNRSTILGAYCSGLSERSSNSLIALRKLALAADSWPFPR